MELQLIQNKIYEIRGHKVMLDFDLAELYEVQTKALNQAVKRNIQRFPVDFMFRLTLHEWKSMRSLIATASGNDTNMRSQNVTASQKKRNVSAIPYAFTEQGLAMLSGILNSDKAINVNIAIMRAFVMVRQYALTYKELTAKLKEIESKFTDVYEAINYLLNKDKQQIEQKQRKQIGFYPGNDKHQTMVQDKRQKLKDKSEKGTLGTRRTTQGRKTTCRESQTGNRKTLNTEHFKMNKNI